MAKTRSPNYPQVDFGEALEKARLIYKSAHQHSITDEQIASALEYKSLNGRSMGVISAIKKYGLLVPDGDGHKISEDAFNVLELPPDSQEHFESLKKMAFTPQVFVELQETYGEHLPSDQILRHYLIKNKFNPNVADEVIKNFRATIELVTQAEQFYNKNMKATALQPSESSTKPIIVPVNNQRFYGGGYAVPIKESPFGDAAELSEPLSSNQELKFRLSADSDVRLIFRGDVTQEAVTKLIKLLELSMDTFPSQASLSTTPIAANRLEEKSSESESETFEEISADFRRG